MVWGETARLSTEDWPNWYVSEKRKVSFGSVMTHIRTRLRFALLRSIVTALRGVRGRKSGSGMKDLSNVNFDHFVPEGEMYIV